MVMANKLQHIKVQVNTCNKNYEFLIFLSYLSRVDIRLECTVNSGKVIKQKKYFTMIFLLNKGDFRFLLQVLNQNRRSD